MKRIFTYRRRSGAVLTESLQEDRFVFTYADCDGERTLFAYRPGESAESFGDRLYLGHTLDEVIDSPTDVLGEKILEKGEPKYSDLFGVLPKVTDGAYCFLGGAASHSGVTVDTMGVVYSQESGGESSPSVIFDPAKGNGELSGIAPSQYILDGRYPVLFNVFERKDGITELLYFVDSNDTDRYPIVWIREKKMSPSLDGITVRYGVKEISHGYAAKCEDIYPVDESLWLEALSTTVAYWLKFKERGIRLSLPTEELAKVGEGAMIFAAQTFTGPRPHYGHRFYGRELHDNFPPNYIWSIEAACILGQVDFARDIFRHLITLGLSDEGSFAYRQGRYIGGASAAEYGMLLWIIGRYGKRLMPCGIEPEYKRKLCGMGNEILSHLVSCPEFSGLKLVKMCAEADNNTRVNVYLNNNLWACRGLAALSELIGEGGEKYAASARLILDNVNKLLREQSERDEDLGAVPPFRFGYPAIPYTLSNCKTDRLPTDKEKLEAYFKYDGKRREYDTVEQEITENTYANYRYYPEALSAMLLSRELSDGIEAARERLGGNILGMARLRHWVDDWPVLNYARFLIETDRIDKYLLLLFAHTQHHGNPSLMCYYEQIKLFGKVSAPDCVPSLLTTPIMLGWAFAYERVEDNRLCLLEAIPKEWFDSRFSAHGVGVSFGEISVDYDGGTLDIKLSRPAPDGFSVRLRCASELESSMVSEGDAVLLGIEGDRLNIKGGVSRIRIKLR